MTWDLLVRGGRMLVGERLEMRDFAVAGGRVAALFAPGEAPPDGAKVVLDAQGLTILPGCVDAHTHMFDPGYPLREDFLSGTSAAAKGGVTTIIDMPCSSEPTIRSVADARCKLDAISAKAVVDFALWGGVTGEEVRAGRLCEVAALADLGVVGFKVYMTSSLSIFPSVSHSEMVEAFRAVAETGLVGAVHAEDPELCHFHTERLKARGRKDPLAWAEARLPFAEKVAISYCIQAAELAGSRLHIVHMTTADGVRLIAEAKARGLPVSAETCPQYLTLTAEEALPRWGAVAKIAPPLRSAGDCAELWDGLSKGTVDFVATDHAPFDWDTEKNGADIWQAFSGFPGVETMLPLMLTEGYHAGRLSLSRMVQVLSENPARQYGLYPRKGALQVGSDADFVLVDLERRWVFSATEQESRAKYSPFHGRVMIGKPVQTFVRGQRVYDESAGICGKHGVWVRP